MNEFEAGYKVEIFAEWIAKSACLHEWKCAHQMLDNYDMGKYSQQSDIEKYILTLKDCPVAKVILSVSNDKPDVLLEVVYSDKPDIVVELNSLLRDESKRNLSEAIETIRKQNLRNFYSDIIKNLSPNQSEN